MADAERLAKLREDLEKACKAQKFSKILKKANEVLNIDGEDVGDLSELTESLCLRNCTWKAVEHQPASRIGFLDTLFDQRQYHIVWHKCPAVHVRLGFQTNGGTGSNRCSQHVACRNLGQACLFRNSLCLRTFSCARGTKQDDAAHVGGKPSSLSILTDSPVTT